MQKEFLSVKDYAATQINPKTGTLGISVQAVYTRIRYGKIKSVKIGKMILIKVR